MRFTKMHGLGNDFIFINCFEERIVNASSLAVELCDRRYSIGADGIILVYPSDTADFRMEMYNCDGSIGKMCGNGIRCFAKYVYHKQMTRENIIRIETLSGVKTCELTVKGVRVNMGVPVFSVSLLNVVSDRELLIDTPVIIEGMRYSITCLSVGNLHCVVFFDEVEHLDLELLGPKFESSRMFPDRVNTGFVQKLSDGTLKMREWERGAGETYACGTGACAAFCAAKEIGIIKDECSLIRLKGGDLEVEWQGEDREIYLTGSAEFVFDGIIKI